MTPEEEKQIMQWDRALDHDVQVHLITTKDERSALLADFCDDLQAVSSNVKVLREEGVNKDLPAIRIHKRLRYHAVPLGRELMPFLMAINGSPSRALRSLPPAIKAKLKTVEIPAFLQLFIAPQCPHCPQTVRQLLPLTVESDQIQCAIIDGFLFPEMAERYDIRSVPTLLLDDRFRWTGSVPLDELVELAAHRDPGNLGISSLEDMLKEGRAPGVAEMMLGAREIIPAFIDVLTHEKMFVRLGAMVVMEILSERDPALAQQAIPMLWDRFPEASEQVQGDIVHVVGETGDRRSVSRLEDILGGAFGADIKEAAQDALERIRKEK
jgi:hypothetical protein